MPPAEVSTQHYGYPDTRLDVPGPLHVPTPTHVYPLKTAAVNARGTNAFATTQPSHSHRVSPDKAPLRVAGPIHKW